MLPPKPPSVSARRQHQVILVNHALTKILGHLRRHSCRIAIIRSASAATGTRHSATLQMFHRSSVTKVGSTKLFMQVVPNCQEAGFAALKSAALDGMHSIGDL